MDRSRYRKPTPRQRTVPRSVDGLAQAVRVIRPTPVARPMQPRTQAPPPPARPVIRSRGQAIWQAMKLPQRGALVMAIFVLACAGTKSVYGATRPPQPVAVVVQAPTDVQQTAYKAAVKAILAQHAGITTTVITRNMASGQQLQIGYGGTYVAASTAKLLTATTYLQGVNSGKLQLQNVLPDGNTAMTDLERMVVDSDNNAWQTLNDYLTHDTLATTAAALGMTHYDPESNTMTAADMALLEQKIWYKQAGIGEQRTKLLDWMQRANYRTEIIPAVPNNYTVYHKVGDVDGYLHDAAIITQGDQAMQLVIFTNGNGDEDNATRDAMMQAITKAALAAYF